MKKGIEITGTRYAEKPRFQYHMSDKGGRAYLCRCMSKIRTQKEVIWTCFQKKGRKAKSRPKVYRSTLNLWWSTHKNQQKV